MSKQSWVALALLAASCGRGDDAPPLRPRVHYVLDDDGIVAGPANGATPPRAVVDTPSGAVPAARARGRDVRAPASGDADPADIRDDPVDNASEASEAVMLNYGIFSDPVLGN